LTRIDLTTREWHELIKPVLPHASTDADQRELASIRIELAEYAIYAVATDRYTIGAERHELKPGIRLWDIPQPVHVWASEAKASLGLFAYSKDYDPPLRLTVDTMPVPVAVAGRQTTVGRLAVTVEADDGTRLVLHNHRDPSNDPLAAWRKHLAGPFHRQQAASAPALNLNAVQLARWAAACRKGERLAFFTGTQGDELVLVAVENHFLGAWKPQSYLTSPAEMLAASPWRDELAEVPWLATASGVNTAAEASTPDAPAETRPWVAAKLAGKCAGCGEPVNEGDQIQSDGEGGWVCTDCGWGEPDA
jgi:hypothetical protein